MSGPERVSWQPLMPGCIYGRRCCRPPHYHTAVTSASARGGSDELWDRLCIFPVFGKAAG